MRVTVLALLFLTPFAGGALGRGKTAKAQTTPLDDYIEQAMRGAGAMPPAAPGSLWTAQSALADLAIDMRARFANDLLTILVVERASAVASGAVQSARQSSAKSSIGALYGTAKPALSNLANISGETTLDGAASTRRDTMLSTTLAARVTHVLPNGYLVVAGTKELQLNSERQTVTIRGVARPADIDAGNVIRSDRLAQLEVRINGKGVIGDAIRRPFFLYRLLLGLLPF